MAARVLHVVWAGTGWDRLQPLLDHQLLLALEHVTSRGVRAQLTSLQPQVPAQLAQSVLSGQAAWKHGLVHPLHKLSDGTFAATTLADATDPGLPAWLAAAGQTGLWVGWPHLLPNSLPNQWMVHRGFASPQKENSQGDGLQNDELGECSLLGCRVSPDSIGLDHLKPFFPDIPPDDILADPMTPVLQAMLAEAGSLQAAATRLMRRNDWHLASVRFELADQMSHWCGDCHPPIQEHTDPQRLLRYQHMVTGAYRLLDMMLARLVNLAGPEATVMLHSDKGSARPAPPSSANTPLHIRFRSGHDDRGFLVLAGPDVDPGSPLFAASVLDIAPTLLALSGLQQDGMQGRMLLEGFKPGRIEPSSPVPAELPRVTPPTAEIAATVLADLIAHGECRAAESYENDQLDTEIKLYQALNMLQYGAADQALSVLEQLTDRHPQERRYILHRARCHLVLSQLDVAAEWADRFVQSGEPDLHSHLLQGRIALLQAKPDQALVHFFQAEQIKPNDASSHCQIGDAYLSASRLEQARDAFGRALSLDNMSVAAHLGLARIAIEEGNFEKACDTCLCALEADYRNPDAHFQLGVGLAKLQKTSESIQAFETCLRLAPGRKATHQWLAHLYKFTDNGVEKAALHKAWSL